MVVCVRVCVCMISHYVIVHVQRQQQQNKIDNQNINIVTRGIALTKQKSI